MMAENDPAPESDTRSIWDRTGHLSDRQIQVMILEELRLLNNTLAPFAARFGGGPLSGRKWGKQ